MPIAIIGATGMLGKPVTEELIKAGFAVRIIARNVPAAQRLFPAAEVVFGDLRQPESLAPALAGCEAVYLSLSVKQTEREGDFHTETDGMQHLLAAAKQANVQRIAYLSSIVMRYQGQNGFDWWTFRVKHEAVRLIRESGLDYSIFYPSNFMETMLTTQRMGPLVLVVGTGVANHSAVRPWFIAASDYGRQVARALQLAQPGEAQEYVVQGPEPVSQLDAARRLARTYTKRRLRVAVLPPALLRFGSLFSPQADYGWHIGEALNGYPEAFEAQRTWNDLGHPTLTVEAWSTTPPISSSPARAR
jgi:uncharacterized protein YbjT (DUF2867 family)